jgi:hypothetical protein
MPFLLASCAEAEITYSYSVYQSGEIVQSFEVKIDEESLKTAFPDEENLKAYAAYIRDTVKIIFEDISYAAEIRKDGTVYAERYFESRTDFNIFYGITGDEPPDAYDESFYKVGGVFFDTYVTKTESVFGDIEDVIADVRDEGSYLNPTGEVSEQDRAVIEKIKDDILLIDYELFTYVFKYNTYLDSLDMNADVKELNEETGMHTFTFFMDHETKGRVIEYTQRVPNVTAWFLTAAGVSVLVVLTVYGISAVLKMRGKENASQ